jgi:DNA invertase Pin-like site-specific DNA recombinase
MRRGYIRESPRHPARYQREALEAAGCRAIYEQNGEALSAFVRGLRKGDIVVVDGLHRLAATRPDFHRAIHAIERKGAQVMDARSGQIVDSKCVALVAEAFSNIAGEARIKDAAALGEQGGRPKIKLKRDQREIWRDLTIPSNAEAADIIGVSTRTLYRRYGPSGRPAGWPERLTTGRKPKPSK